MTVMTVEHRINLKCHPSKRPVMVRAINVLVRRTVSAELKITYRVEGDIRHIQVPSPGSPRIGTELWRHTCFEVFIAADGQPGYHEVNFAPSGEWTVYAFSSYRNGSPLAIETMRPQIAVLSTSEQLELDSIVRLDSLSSIHPHTILRIGLSAIIEASDGFSHWALRHPVEKPDFHNIDGFDLLLEPPGRESSSRKLMLK
jgi:hypothetical protein